MPSVDKNVPRTKARELRRQKQRDAGLIPREDKKNDLTPKPIKPSAQRIQENQLIRETHVTNKPLFEGIDHGAVSMDPDKPLTEKQRRFAQALAKGISVPAASREAGYNDRSAMGYKMVKSPAVMRVVDEEREAYQEACNLSRQAVMEGMKEAIDMAQLQAEPATMIAGWRQIGLLCGYYAPAKLEVDVNLNGGNAMQKLNSMSDKELMEVMSGQGGRLIEGEVVNDDDPR